MELYGNAYPTNLDASSGLGNTQKVSACLELARVTDERDDLVYLGLDISYRYTMPMCHLYICTERVPKEDALRMAVL
jgi:hypothetical protein